MRTMEDDLKQINTYMKLFTRMGELVDQRDAFLSLLEWLVNVLPSPVYDSLYDNHFDEMEKIEKVLQERSNDNLQTM